MITADQLVCVGRVIKPHGIDGEMSVSFPDPGFIASLSSGACLIFSIDGIFVPFFVKSVRPRGSESLLISLDGEGSKDAASRFAGCDVYMLANDVRSLSSIPDDEPQEGLYAEQLIGYEAVTDSGDTIGTISDIDDSTDNPLFIILPAQGDAETLLIPIVDDFICEIDTDHKRISFSLPEGLLNL